LPSLNATHTILKSEAAHWGSNCEKPVDPFL
jgi:hypothetical protein